MFSHQQSGSNLECFGTPKLSITKTTQDADRLEVRKRRYISPAFSHSSSRSNAMKRLFALTLCALLASNCSTGYRKSYGSKGSTMTYGVGTQAELDEANQRINAFKQDLLRQGFRTVSVSFSDSKEESILEGQYGRLKDLRVTLQTNERLEKEAPEVAGGRIHASISDEQADREFEELYKNVITVVTGRPQ